MMKIRLKKKWEHYIVGDTIEVSEAMGTLLVETKTGYEVKDEKAFKTPARDKAVHHPSRAK